MTQPQSSRQNTVLGFFLELFCMFYHDGTISSQDAAFSASCVSGSCAFSLHLFCGYLAANGYACHHCMIAYASSAWSILLANVPLQEIVFWIWMVRKQCVHILLPMITIIARLLTKSSAWSILLEKVPLGEIVFWIWMAGKTMCAYLAAKGYACHHCMFFMIVICS